MHARNPSQVLRFSWILLGLSLGCTSGSGAGPGASVGGAGTGGSGTGPGGVPVGTNPGGVTLTCDKGAAPGVSPLMKLSTREYKNTVQDLLSAVGAGSVQSSIDGLVASIPDDSLADGFRGRDNRTALEHVQG